MGPAAPLTEGSTEPRIRTVSQRMADESLTQWTYMALRVGRIKYLEFEPFYFDMPRRGIELHDMAPNSLAAAAEQGQIDAGPVPLTDSWGLEDRFQPVSGFCVATTEQSRDILFYSKLCWKY